MSLRHEIGRIRWYVHTVNSCRPFAFILPFSPYSCSCGQHLLPVYRYVTIRNESKQQSFACETVLLTSTWPCESSVLRQLFFGTNVTRHIKPEETNHAKNFIHHITETFQFIGVCVSACAHAYEIDRYICWFLLYSIRAMKRKLNRTVK